MRTQELRILVVVAAVLMSGGHAVPSETNGQSGLALGKEVFTEITQPPCGVCHTLADAGTTGTTGPYLDDEKPNEEDVKLTVTEGVGVMPAYGQLLTEEQIDAVAKYVSTVAGNAERKADQE